MPVYANYFDLQNLLVYVYTLCLVGFKEQQEVFVCGFNNGFHEN